MVADTFQFVSKVIDVKSNFGYSTALLTGSVYNVRPTKSSRNLPVSLIRGRGARRHVRGPLDFVGYTCMEDDILHRGFQGTVSVGDFVVFDNVGAYTFVLKPPFILPSPPVLAAVNEGSEIVQVRRQETFDDVFATYNI